MSEFVLTKSVRDVAGILDAVQGPMPGDLFVAPPPLRPYRSEVGADPGRLRVGLLTHHPGELKLEVHPECIEAVEATGRLLESLGHGVEYSYPTQFDGPTGLGRSYLGVIAAAAKAATLDAWSERIGRPIGPDDVEASTWEQAEEGRRHSAVEVMVAYNRIAAGTLSALKWWHEGHDILVTPTRAQPPIPLGETDSAKLLAACGQFTTWFSFTGQPAVSLPLHWTPDGLPVGVQLVADYGREDLLIRLASQLEQARPWRERRPAVYASAT
jgi:amidase